MRDGKAWKNRAVNSLNNMLDNADENIKQPESDKELVQLKRFIDSIMTARQWLIIMLGDGVQIPEVYIKALRPKERKKVFEDEDTLKELVKIDG